MADNPVFDPEKVIGSEIGSLSAEELVALCKKLCETACTQCNCDGYRGGFRPGNICRLEDGGITVGPSAKAGEDGRSKEELEYMAPEVFWSGEKNAAADVYSIGLVLYAGLNGGRPPFIALSGDEPSPDERANALRTRMNGEKITPPDIAGEALGKVIEKALEFKTSDRFSDTLELLNALRSLSGEAPLALEDIPPVPAAVIAEKKPAEDQAVPVVEEIKPVAEEKVEEKAPEPKENPAKAEKAEPKRIVEEKAAAQAEAKRAVIPEYQRRANRVKAATLGVIAVLLIAAGFAHDNIDFSFKAPEPTVIVTPEPTPVPTLSPTPTPSPTPLVPARSVIIEDISWDMAEQRCRELGGHLATVTSEEDYAEICRLLQDVDAQYVWIGCYRNNNGDFAWTSGVDSDFFKWADGEPSERDSNDGANEDYVMLVKQADGTWLYNDNRMDPMAEHSDLYGGKMAFICQVR